eukprot:CAMPEP_0179024656 /NCGR_PEP_ID=MMETSP0796-20121207/7564_1 /TAXON_ID=73915 /ORGANISM="Pyrodinium bahamense, Strain pbaha01" /LENGTH=815 /DNA_ID=CAMNT_0020720617 /DNA_START=55 /DNA_END=2500 /DNA_ORIENTATION=+
MTAALTPACSEKDLGAASNGSVPASDAELDLPPPLGPEAGQKPEPSLPAKGQAEPASEESPQTGSVVGSVAPSLEKLEPQAAERAVESPAANPSGDKPPADPLLQADAQPPEQPDRLGEVGEGNAAASKPGVPEQGPQQQSSPVMQPSSEPPQQVLQQEPFHDGPSSLNHPQVSRYYIQGFTSNPEMNTIYSISDRIVGGKRTYWSPGQDHFMYFAAATQRWQISPSVSVADQPGGPDVDLFKEACQGGQRGLAIQVQETAWREWINGGWGLIDLQIGYDMGDGHFHFITPLAPMAPAPAPSPAAGWAAAGPGPPWTHSEACDDPPGQTPGRMPMTPVVNHSTEGASGFTRTPREVLLARAGLAGGVAAPGTPLPSRMPQTPNRMPQTPVGPRVPRHAPTSENVSSATYAKIHSLPERFLPNGLKAPPLKRKKVNEDPALFNSGKPPERFSIWVGHFPESVTHDELMDFFSACGPVLDQERKKSQAVFHFNSAESQAFALGLNGGFLSGKMVEVREQEHFEPDPEPAADESKEHSAPDRGSWHSAHQRDSWKEGWKGDAGSDWQQNEEGWSASSNGSLGERWSNSWGSGQHSKAGRKDWTDRRAEKTDWKVDKTDWNADKTDWKADKTDWKADKTDWKSDKVDRKADKIDWKADSTDWKADNSAAIAGPGDAKDGREASWQAPAVARIDAGQALDGGRDPPLGDSMAPLSGDGDEEEFERLCAAAEAAANASAEDEFQKLCAAAEAEARSSRGPGGVIDRLLAAAASEEAASEEAMPLQAEAAPSQAEAAPPQADDVDDEFERLCAEVLAAVSDG